MRRFARRQRRAHRRQRLALLRIDEPERGAVVHQQARRIRIERGEQRVVAVGRRQRRRGHRRRGGLGVGQIEHRARQAAAPQLAGEIASVAAHHVTGHAVVALIFRAGRRLGNRQAAPAVVDALHLAVAQIPIINGAANVGVRELHVHRRRRLRPTLRVVVIDRDLDRLRVGARDQERPVRICRLPVTIERRVHDDDRLDARPARRQPHANRSPTALAPSHCTLGALADVGRSAPSSG